MLIGINCVIITGTFRADNHAGFVISIHMTVDRFSSLEFNLITLPKGCQPFPILLLRPKVKLGIFFLGGGGSLLKVLSPGISTLKISVSYKLKNPIIDRPSGWGLLIKIILSTTTSPGCNDKSRGGGRGHNTSL